MADTKLLDLPDLASPNATDILYGVANPGILPLSSKVTIGALATAVGLTWSGADSRIRTSSAGTVALPALSHAADPNTGIYFIAPDQIAIATAGVLRQLFGATGTSQYNGNTANGQARYETVTAELTTIEAAAFTDTVIQIPANAIAFAASVRVTVIIPTAATFDVGIAGATTRYATGVAVAAGTSHPGTTDSFRFYGTATSIRITPNLQPADNTGRVRVTLHYIQIQPATS